MDKHWRATYPLTLFPATVNYVYQRFPFRTYDLNFFYLQRHVKGNVHWRINCARDANDYLYCVFSQRELVGLLSTSQYRKILTLRL